MAEGGAIVRREPRTYERHDLRTSWFRDMALTIHGVGQDDPSAAARRLDRHAAEVRAELPALEQRLGRQLGGAGRPLDVTVETEARALTRVDGSGGDFVGPIWLMEDWASANRASGVWTNIAQVRQLPGGTDSINAPRVATGVTAAIQATDNAATSSTDLTAATVTAPVRTIAGTQDVAQQMFDQMTTGVGFDQGVVGDLADAYSAQLDLQCTNGTGASGQLKGVLQVSGIGNVTYVDATPTVTELWPKLAGAANTMATTRFRQPSHVIMHPRRWYWMTAAADLQGRPLVLAESEGAYDEAEMAEPEGFAAETPWGDLWIDANVPTNLGGGTEDAVIFVRARDLFLFLSPPRLRVRVFPEVGSGNLTMRLQVVTYAAFLSERAPTAIATVTGSGLAAAGVVF